MANLKGAFKAGADTWRTAPLYITVLPFVIVGIVGVLKALHRSDFASAGVSAMLWWFVAPLLWAWWIRRR